MEKKARKENEKMRGLRFEARGNQHSFAMVKEKQEPLFRKLESEFQKQEKSEYEQRKAHLKSLRSLIIPVHSEEWKKQVEDHEKAFFDQRKDR